MEISFRVEGLQHLQRKLETIKNLERDPRVNQALGRGAARIQAQVKLLTPVDTGNLRNKIISQQAKFMEWVVETNVEYAIFVEFGTGRLGDPAVPHTSKDSWTYYSEELKRFITTHGQEPAAMFRTGFDLAHKQAFRIVETEVKEIIRHG
jgi:HK97 gp10 family phage protein